jgi:hypothetical protein
LERRPPTKAAKTIASINVDTAERLPEKSADHRMVAFMQRDPHVIGCGPGDRLAATIADDDFGDGGLRLDARWNAAFVEPKISHHLPAISQLSERKARRDQRL